MNQIIREQTHMRNKVKNSILAKKKGEQKDKAGPAGD
jgi:hypothetical protein